MRITNYIYVLARWQNKIFVYSESGVLIRKIQIPFPATAFRFCRDGILCYCENHMSNIENSYFLIDSIGTILKTFPNRYPFKFNDAAGFRGENLFYNYNGNLFKKEIYSDTVYMFENQMFLPHISIQVGNKLLTTDVRSKHDGLYICENYVYPRNLFEFADYIYYDFCYSIKIPDDVLVYRFIGSKINNSFKLIDYDEGIINDLDGGPNIFPKTLYDNNTIISVVDAIKLKNHVNSDLFQLSNPLYPEKKKELEKIAEKISMVDNPILIMVSLK